MYGYIYRTHNKINGKMYLGMKKSRKFMAERYLGSGKILHKAIEKYGKDNFYVELIERCDSKEKLIDREKYWIEHYNATENPMYYNLVEGGHGSFDYINDNRLSPSCVSKESHPMYNRKGKDNPRYGMKHSEETKEKISKSQINRRSITNGVITKRIKRNEELPEGFEYGESYSEARKWSNERKEKFVEQMVDTTVINNGSITKRVKSEDLDYYLDRGYNLGYRDDQIRTGKHAPAYGMKHSDEFKEMISKNTKGRIWINDGLKNKRVFGNELDKYINSGWVKGRISRKSNDYRKHSVEEIST